MIDVTELEKEYAFDMMKIGTPDWEGVPYLLKIDSSYYEFAKKHNLLVTSGSDYHGKFIN